MASSLVSEKIFVSVLAALCTWYLADIVRVWLRLRHIPGPYSAGFSKWWLLRTAWSQKQHLELFEACNKYGTLVRIGPNDLVTSDPAQMRKMTAVRSKYTRSEWYDGTRLDPSRDNILSQRDDQKHSVLRSKMAAGYAGKEIDKLEGLIDENIATLIKLLDEKYVSTVTGYRAVDFATKIAYFTLDIISSIAFGKAFGDMETDSDVYGYIDMLHGAAPVIIVMAVFPFLVKFAQLPIMQRLAPSAKDTMGFGRVMGVAKEIVAERFGPKKKVQRDMLGSFLAHGLTQEEAESELLINILGGSDTSATAIRMTMLHLTTNPLVLSKLRAEISSTLLSSPIKDSEAKKMPYLQAVIKEGLRIHPPVAGLSSKEVPAGGDTINGRFIPGGTKIGICFWGIVRSSAIWAPDANQFRPERWLEVQSPEKLTEMEQTLDLVFSHGKWHCLGKAVAIIELNKVFVELLRKFDFQIVDPAHPMVSMCSGVFLQRDMMMRVTRR